MSYSSILEALDILVEYPDLIEYIKKFNSDGGFMFTKETDTHRKECEIRLDNLLNGDGNHSGGSWGCMLRGIQAVLNGMWTLEDLIEKVADEERRMKEIDEQWNERENARRRQEEAAAI